MSFYVGVATTPLGALTLNWVNNMLVAVSFGNTPPQNFLQKYWQHSVWQKNDKLAESTTKNWFNAAGKLDWATAQTTPHQLYGTDFQTQVWQALINHAQQTSGQQTTSYGALAKKINKPNAARAVGGALNKNPLLLLMPCHLVVGHNGALTGFAAGLAVKKQLLGV